VIEVVRETVCVAVAVDVCVAVVVEVVVVVVALEVPVVAADAWAVLTTPDPTPFTARASPTATNARRDRITTGAPGG
jgi:hypothetical protein